MNNSKVTLSTIKMCVRNPKQNQILMENQRHSFVRLLVSNLDKNSAEMSEGTVHEAVDVIMKYLPKETKVRNMNMN